MNNAKAHFQLHDLRPDEVAECWEGIASGSSLYTALWNLMNDIPSDRANIEDRGPEPAHGRMALASPRNWRRLSLEHRRELNRLAVAKQEEFESWLASSESRWG